MSQVDKLTFIPHIFWFSISFVLLYFLLFSFVLPLIFQARKVRSLFLLDILLNSFIYNHFNIFIDLLSKFKSKNIFLKIVIFYLIKGKNLYNLRYNFFLQNLYSSIIYI